MNSNHVAARNPVLRRLNISALCALLIACASGAAAASSQWPMSSHDYANSNANPDEKAISPASAPMLRRKWETFNDGQWRPGAPPTGFILEGALGLRFPSTVVGVVSPPVIQNGTIYYIDELGTVFARDAKTGTITDPRKHWTTTLVDPEYATSAKPIAPELYYTAPVVTDTHVLIHSGLNGHVHVLRRSGGAEVDFDAATPGVQPYTVLPGQILTSGLGEPVVIHTEAPDGSDRALYICEMNVILNDALTQGKDRGTIVALDITNPEHPFEVWRTTTIDNNPATGKSYGTGASAGSGMAVDKTRHLIFGGTGQNTSTPYAGYPDPALAPAGYVDRGDSLYAIDYLTGKFVWSNQFHRGDVFDLNHPVTAGPGRSDGPRDADVLSPPIMFSARTGSGAARDLVGGGSKGGLFRVVDRVSGQTVWERQISKPTGLGGIQGGAAYADGVVYVAGFEGIDDGFSDANFDAPGSKYLNAFFATFSPAFWADVEDTRDDGLALTGMRTKVYALDAGTGRALWNFGNGTDYLSLPAGASMRHVSVANGLVYVTTTSGQLFVVEASSGRIVFRDQTPDLNQVFNLGLGKPHHAAMNGGTVISDGMVYVPYGGQNNPSGGIIAYELNQAPLAQDDALTAAAGKTVNIYPLANDRDPNGDLLRISSIEGVALVAPVGGASQFVTTQYGVVEVVNGGAVPYLRLTPRAGLRGAISMSYGISDVAPQRRVNGKPVAGQNETSHKARSDSAHIRIDFQ
ncbi:MAG: PQQ-binding-like beta-propeller repeat protein [Pseudomonadota bacterium]